MKGVFCYRNLNRKGVVWSVKSNRTGLVVARSRVVVIKDVEFKVSQAGRKRVLRDKRKNVHAGVRGTWCRGPEAQLLFQVSLHYRQTTILNELTFTKGKWTRVKYNPYEGPTFVRQDNGRPIKEARYVVLDQQGAWACLVD